MSRNRNRLLGKRVRIVNSYGAEPENVGREGIVAYVEDADYDGDLSIRVIFEGEPDDDDWAQDEDVRLAGRDALKRGDRVQLLEDYNGLSAGLTGRVVQVEDEDYEGALDTLVDIDGTTIWMNERTLRVIGNEAAAEKPALASTIIAGDESSFTFQLEALFMLRALAVPGGTLTAAQVDSVINAVNRVKQEVK